MEKSFVNNYLIANGKYFPKRKLNKIGFILELKDLPVYAINKRYFNPLTTTLIFWVFYPIQLFDRLILKDWFWGIIKLVFPLILFYILHKYEDGIYLGILTLRAKIIAALFLIWGVWTIIDGFTIYRRTKTANYKSFLKAININSEDDLDYTLKTAKNISNAPNLNEELIKWRK